MHNDRGTHRRLRTFSRLNAVGEGRRLRSQEIIHLIVKQNSGSRADPQRPKTTQRTRRYLVEDGPPKKVYRVRKNKVAPESLLLFSQQPLEILMQNFTVLFAEMFYM